MYTIGVKEYSVTNADGTIKCKIKSGGNDHIKILPGAIG